MSISPEVIKTKILILEDNPGDMLLIEEYLLEKFEKLTISHFSDLQSAMGAMDSGSDYSVCLLDLFLPDIGGFELVQKVKEACANTPIIILTGYADFSLARKCISYGISDILLKDELNSELLHKSILYAIDRFRFIKSLENAKQLYHSLFNFTPQPMWIYDDTTFKILNVNNAAIEKYGYTMDEFLSMTIYDIRPPDQIYQLEKRLSISKELRNEPFAGVFTHRLKNGERIQVEIFSSEISYEGQLSRIVLSNDVTQKLKYINTIEEQNNKLRRIAWTQSHVVRTPLSRLIGIVDLLEENPDEMANLQFWLQKVKDSAVELDQLIRTIVIESEALNIQNNEKL